MSNDTGSLEKPRVAADAAVAGRRKKRVRRLALYALPLIALLFAYLVNPYIQYVLNLVLIYVLITVGFNVAST